MKELTKAEEQVMQYLWKINKGQLKDIIAQFPEPRPAYTTVATVVKALVDKGYVKFAAKGKQREYEPAVEKPDYSKRIFGKWFSNFFEGPKASFFSYFIKEKELNVSELEEVRRLLDEEIEKKKKSSDNN